MQATWMFHVKRRHCFAECRFASPLCCNAVPVCRNASRDMHPKSQNGEDKREVAQPAPGPTRPMRGDFLRFADQEKHGKFGRCRKVSQMFELEN